MIYIRLIVIFSLNLINCFDSNQTDRQYVKPEVFFNTELDEQNPSSFWPPRTDAGAPSPFKYPLSFAHADRYSAGWSREVTVMDLPIATSMAGMQMRLIRGGIHEMHWHVSSEWAYIIYGQVRITAVGLGGRAFVDDLEAGDVWAIPAAWGHSIQAIGDDGALFLVVHNDGTGSRTFLLTDWLNHTPKEVLSKNFQTPEPTFANIPRSLVMFPGPPPLSLDEDMMQASMGTGLVNQSLSFYASRMRPNVTRTGGTIRFIDRNNFAMTDIAAAIATLSSGGMREMHWHPNADEWQYYVRGRARMTVFDANGVARTMDFKAGDVGYVPQAFGHYIESTCEEEVLFLEMFATQYIQDISLAQWLAHTPPLLVDQHIRTGQNFINRINKTEALVVPW